MKLDDIITLNEQPGNAENKSFRKAPPPTGDKMSTAQAAKELGVTPSRVRQLKMEKKLKTAEGPVEGRRDTLIRTTEIKSKKEHKDGPGRPSKDKSKKDDKDDNE